MKLEELNDLEQMYIVDGLEAMLKDKRQAYALSVQLAKEAGIKQPFSERDFGIPAIENLKARFNETFYGPEEIPQTAEAEYVTAIVEAATGVDAS